MKALIFSLFISMVGSYGYAQNGNKSSVDTSKNEKSYVTVVEVMPEFPGGEEALLGFLSENLKYPEPARLNKLTGTVYVSFVVDDIGDIGEVKVMRGMGAGCDEEAVRLIKAMPRWKPGKHNGKNVAASCSIPVAFKLPNKKKK